MSVTPKAPSQGHRGLPEIGRAYAKDGRLVGPSTAFPLDFQVIRPFVSSLPPWWGKVARRAG